MKPLKKTKARMARRTASYAGMLKTIGTVSVGGFTAPGSENRHKGAPVGTNKKKRR